MLANGDVKIGSSFAGWSLMLLFATTVSQMPSHAQDLAKQDTPGSVPAKRSEEEPGKNSAVTADQIRKALTDAATNLNDLKITVVEKGNYDERTDGRSVPVVFKEMLIHSQSMQVRMDFRNDGNGDDWWKGFKSTKGPLAVAHFNTKTELEECVDMSRELIFADARPMSTGPNGEPRSLHSISKTSHVVNNLLVPLFEFERPWVAHRMNGAPVIDQIARQPLSDWRVLSDEKLGDEEVVVAVIRKQDTISVPLKRHEGKLGLTPVHLGSFAKKYGLMPIRIEASMLYHFQGRDYLLERHPEGKSSLVYEASDFRRFGDVWVPFVGNQCAYRQIETSGKGFAPDDLVDKLLTEGKIRDSGERKLGYGYEWRILDLERIDASSSLWFEPHDGAEVFNTDTRKRYIQGDPIASAKFAARENAIEALIGQPAPDFPDGATWINDKPLTWKSLRGKVVILDFWADSCGPCRNDLPALCHLHDDRGENGMVVIGVHISGSERESIQKIIDEFQLKYPICIDVPNKEEKDADEYVFPGEFTTKFAIGAIPHFVVVDQRGVVRTSLINDFEEVLKAAQELVKVNETKK